MNIYSTPWISIWYCIFVQFFFGLQGSVFYTSMWSYLSSLNPDITVGYYGWCIASFSLAQAISSPIFGLWSEKSSNLKIPTTVGLLFICSGNFLYFLLTKLTVKQLYFFAIFNRVICGIGEGCLSVIRAYIATACNENDRSKAVTIGFGAYVLGLAFGPTIQLLFIPLGSEETLKNTFYINVYNAPAFTFSILSIIFIFGLYAFKFPYNPKIIQPKTQDSTGSCNTNTKESLNYLPIFVLIYAYVTQQSFASNDEVLAAPFTIALYNWTTEEAIKYNGIIFTVAAFLSVAIYLLLAYDVFGKLDKRKVILTGLILFAVHHLVSLPWSFYDGPLDYVPFKVNSSSEDFTIAGGCSRRYNWCEDTKRVPLVLYIFTMMISFGLAYPCVSSSIGTMYAIVLGNRKQDFFQGILEFFGSLFRCLSPPLLTMLFDATGYKYTMLIQFCLLITTIILIIISWKQLKDKKYNNFYNIYSISASRKNSKNIEAT
uniref:MFS domain-containing protein n=1 Tax=Parastrongyloides trichosuri TaxID=131310 RepID=A0A0N4ZVE6_PARTI